MLPVSALKEVEYFTANLRHELQKNRVAVSLTFSMFLLEEMHQCLDGHLLFKSPHVGQANKSKVWLVFERSHMAISYL